LPVGVRREELLPLADVELAVGLELRIAHHFGRRGCTRRIDDLRVRDADAEALVLLLQQRLLDHLIDHLILNLLLFFARERRGAVLLPVLLVRELQPLLYSVI